TGLSNGTTYYYVVSANYSAGASLNSNEVSATPIAIVPAAPTGVTATAGDQEISVSWKSVSGADSYTVKRGTISGGPYTSLPSVMAGKTILIDTGLSNGTTYYYIVTATNSAGESAASSEVNAQPGPQTGAPGNLSAQPGNKVVSLTWNAAVGANSYNIKQSTVSGGPYTVIGSSITGTSFTATG